MLSVAANESARVAELEALVASARAELAVTANQLASTTAQLTAVSNQLADALSARDRLSRAYQQLFERIELLRRRIFAAKAERINPQQLELEFAATKKKLDALGAELEALDSKAAVDPSSEQAQARHAGAVDPSVGHRPAGKPPAKAKTKPTGRRNLAELDLPEKRVEILDPMLEGNAPRIGWEESRRLGYQRPGRVVIVTARAKYKTQSNQTQETTIVTAPLPRQLISRSLLAPSLMARIIIAKFRFGMPYFRQEQSLAADSIDLDRGTMARMVEDVGATFGAVVLAAADDARRTACCLSTDATGVSIRPEPLADGFRQACRKGRFFVVLADRKHVFFEYQSKHTSAAVCEMFRGYSGYIQADANAVYDALFRGDAVDDPEHAPIEVGCWAHARRKFWEAAVSAIPSDARDC